jgi:hypothetical protein
MRRSVAVTFAFALLAGACDESPFGPSETDVRFSGLVLDYLAETPVPGAVVRFAEDPFTPQAPFVETTAAGDGRYVLTVPRTGVFTVLIDGLIAGTARVNGGGYRGDLFRRSGNCISRYGLIIDAVTLRPVRGATVTLVNRMTTDADGWYRLDLGCPEVVFPGGTTVLTVTHPNYENRSVVVGRGVAGVLRLDVDLQRP